MRWLVLSVYLGALVLTQVFWYNFAPLLSLLVTKYGISELTAGWTVLVFPLASILASGHAGAVIDRRGYRFSIQAGLALMAASSVLRVFDGSFWCVLAGQAGVALAVPYIVTGISKLVTDWFEPGREAFITGLCTVGIFVGMSLSLGVSPLLAAALGFRGAMMSMSAAAIVWALVFKFTVRERRAPVDSGVTPGSTDLRSLLTNRNLLVLFASGFLAQGCFNAFTTWMEVIWHERGFPSAAAGAAGGIVILGGIAGSFLIPPLMDRFPHPRAMLWTCLIPCMFLIDPFLWAASPRAGYLWGAALGFLWLPTLAITLTILERSAPKNETGAAAGIFWTVGNTGVLTLTILFERLRQATDWRTAIYGLILTMAVLNGVTVLLRFPSVRVATHSEAL